MNWKLQKQYVCLRISRMSYSHKFKLIFQLLREPLWEIHWQRWKGQFQCEDSIKVKVLLVWWLVHIQLGQTRFWNSRSVGSDRVWNRNSVRTLLPIFLPSLWWLLVTNRIFFFKSISGRFWIWNFLFTHSLSRITQSIPPFQIRWFWICHVEHLN